MCCYYRPSPFHDEGLCNSMCVSHGVSLKEQQEQFFIHVSLATYCSCCEIKGTCTTVWLALSNKWWLRVRCRPGMSDTILYWGVTQARDHYCTVSTFLTNSITNTPQCFLFFFTCRVYHKQLFILAILTRLKTFCFFFILLKCIAWYSVLQAGVGQDFCLSYITDGNCSVFCT